MQVVRRIIYGLLDPTDLRLRYVGQTSHGLTRNGALRHTKKSEVKKHDHCHRWIHGLIRKGLEPVTIVLEEDVQDLDEAEIRLIRFFKSLGHHLTNMTEGGQGNRGWKVRPETKLLMSFSKRGEKNPQFGKTNDYRGKYWKGRKRSRRSVEMSATKKHKSVVCLSDGIVFPSCKEADTFYGLSRGSSARYSLSGKQINGLTFKRTGKEQ